MFEYIWTVCAVEDVVCGVPNVFVSRQFQRRVKPPVTGGHARTCARSPCELAPQNALETRVHGLPFWTFPDTQGKVDWNR